ncbi:MAG: GatB/YqeY domain-containing protein [Patescibacteria group bacterium]|nr:GatB/YqeY domain-containing protein [Patescibacteria group bacterium]
MLQDSVTKLLMKAIKDKDEVRVSVLRMLSSAINYEKIARQHDLSYEEEIAVVKREVKKRKDAIVAYEKVGALDKASWEQQELEILKEFLPPEISDTELLSIAKQVIQENNFSGVKDMGKAISKVKEKVGFSADGTEIANVVKKILFNGYLMHEQQK